MDPMEAQTDGSPALVCGGSGRSGSIWEEDFRNVQADNLLLFLM